MDGTTFVQRWSCTRVGTPDGSPSVLWRGVVYPLLPGDAIDIGARSEPGVASRYFVMSSEGASWILVQGLPKDLDAARRAIEGAGITVARSGRWLGETVDGRVFDWFLRCEGRIEAATVLALLGAPAPIAAAPDPVALAILLEQRVAGLLAEIAHLKKMRPEAPAQSAAASSAPDPRLIAMLAELETLQAAKGTSRDLPASTPVPRLQGELEGMLRALRPDVRLLRDCMSVAVGEFSSRDGFYRAIQQLPVSGGRPDGWKMLRGAARWWECHVSTGRDDTGRTYARFATGARRWDLLLSWKGEQARDVLWLQRQTKG